MKNEYQVLNPPECGGGIGLGYTIDQEGLVKMLGFCTPVNWDETRNGDGHAEALEGIPVDALIARSQDPDSGDMGHETVGSRRNPAFPIEKGGVVKVREIMPLRILASIGVVGIFLMLVPICSVAAEPTWDQTYDEAKKLDQQGEWAEALRTAKLALKKAEEVFGANSLNVAKSHTLLGDLWAQRGRMVSAEMHYVRGINLREKVLGPKHPSLVNPLTRLSDLYATHGKTELAAATYSQAIEIGDRSGRSRDPSVAAALVGLAGISRQNANYEEAEGLLNRAMDLCDTYRKYDGSLNTLAVRALNDLAEIHRTRSNFSRAADCYHRAVTVLGRENSADKLLMCSLLSRLADTHAENGSTFLAKDYHKRAKALYAAARGPTTAIGLAQSQQ